VGNGCVFAVEGCGENRVTGNGIDGVGCLPILSRPRGGRLWRVPGMIDMELRITNHVCYLFHRILANIQDAGHCLPVSESTYGRYSHHVDCGSYP